MEPAQTSARKAVHKDGMTLASDEPGMGRAPGSFAEEQSFASHVLKAPKQLESPMNEYLASAVFNSETEAQRAVADLRANGVNDAAISLIAQHDGKNSTTDGSGAETATDVVGKAALGAGAGTLLGIAALAIPGVGPLVAAGAIASVAIPGAALTGAAVGAAAGGLAGLLSDHGVDSDDADYYEEHVNNGGVFVSVDTRDAGVSAQTARDILYNAGGHSSRRASAIA